MGILEIILLLILAVMVFGGDLPEVGRKLGEMIGKIKRTVFEFKEEINRETRGIQQDVSQLEQLREQGLLAEGEAPPGLMDTEDADDELDPEDREAFMEEGIMEDEESGDELEEGKRNDEDHKGEAERKNASDADPDSASGSETEPGDESKPGSDSEATP